MYSDLFGAGAAKSLQIMVFDLASNDLEKRGLHCFSLGSIR